MSGGYRFADEEEWPGGKEALSSFGSLETIPVALEIEIEGAYDRLSEREGGLREDSEVKLEEAEVMAGGSFGKSGRISLLAIGGVAQLEGDDGSTDFRGFDGALFVQLNDLIGPAGEGRLNLRGGQFEVALPFFSTARRLIKQGYFADVKLNVLTPGQRAIELNGAVTGEEETNELTHRYSLGVSREDIHGDSKLRGLYLTYALTLREVYNLGLIYRSGKEKSGPTDNISNERFGFALEVPAGPAFLTAGYFVTDRDGAYDLEDYIVEVILSPFNGSVIGARYDILRESGGDEGTAFSVMARYDIKPKIFLQLEYRALDYEGKLAWPNERERKGRIFLVALF